jgi:hypothetical protein
LGWNYWPQILSTVSLARELQIQEYQMPLRLQDLPFWAGLGALIVLTILQRPRLAALERRDRILLLGALVLAVAAVTAARNVAFFAVVAAPALSRVWAARQTVVAPAGRRFRPLGALGWGLCLMVAVGSAVMVVQRWSDPGARLGWEPVSREALGALRECPDRLFNEMLDGGYLIWSLPSHRVFVDGRMEAYPPEVLRASRQADLFGDYEAVFRDYGINCAIVTTGTPLYSKLAADRSMTRTFADAERAVFVRGASASESIAGHR